MRETYGKLLPGMKLTDLAGRLIVIEGTDGAGRTTQINLPGRSPRFMPGSSFPYVSLML